MRAATTASSRATHRVKPILAAAGLAVAVGFAVLAGPLSAQADPDPGDPGFLGSAEDYAIVASDTITETATHQSVVVGDVALDPGTAVGLLPVQVSGDIHVTDTDSTTADSDVNTAYVIVAGQGATDTVGTVNLAARPTPYLAGVYFSGSDLLLDGTMTLQGSADDVFIFQASTGSLTATSDSAVVLIGGAQACNVYWQVGSSATLGTNSTFVGTILAATSIAAQNGASVDGRLLAGATNAGAVTLDNNFINSASTCVRASSTTPGGSGGGTTGTTGGAANTTATGVNELAATGSDPTIPLVVGSLGALFGALLFFISRRHRLSSWA